MEQTIFGLEVKMPSVSITLPGFSHNTTFVEWVCFGFKREFGLKPVWCAKFFRPSIPFAKKLLYENIDIIFGFEKWWDRSKQS
jgi:hypothetical protein